MLENIQILSPLALSPMHWVFIIPICILSVFLTLLILVQRGRGGGLTGALGGMGGQSAFGAKAGDLFTKITIVTAMIWILLSMGALKVLHVGKFSKNVTNTPAPVVPGTTVDPLDTKPGGITPENTAPKKSGDAPKATDPAPSSTPAPPAPPAPAETPAAPAPSAPAPAAPAPATPEKSDDEKK